MPADPKDPRPPKTLAEFDAAIETLLSALDRQLAAIDQEADGKRRAAIERSGLRPELVERLRGGSRESSLTKPDQYAQNELMPQPQSDITPRKVGRPTDLDSAGPFTRAAMKLGVSPGDLAKKLKVNHWTARNWDREGRRIPDDIQPKIDALLAAKAKAKADAKGKK